MLELVLSVKRYFILNVFSKLDLDLSFFLDETVTESITQKLGERYPFGDKELIKLLAIYESLLDKGSKPGSFLLKLTLISYCTNPGLKENKTFQIRTILDRFGLRQFDKKLKDKLYHKDADGLTLFLDGVAQCNRRGCRKASIALFELCSDDKKTAKASEVVNLGYRLCLASSYLSQEKLLLPQSSKNHLNYLYESLLTHEEVYFDKLPDGFVSLERYLSWVEQKFPLFGASLSTFLHHILFPDDPFPASQTPLYFPVLRYDLNNYSSSFFSNPSDAYLFSFACMSSSLTGDWHRLYTSENDGVSFNRVSKSICGYSGPTLFLINSTCGGCFGAFCSSPWKESKEFYGASDCFLFRLLPNVNIFRARGMTRNFIYFNSEARSKGYDGLAHGIGFGGDANQPRLFISETFEDCYASSSDLTYEEGDLLLPFHKSNFFELESLEVWGVGGNNVVQQALKEREMQRDIIEARIKKTRKSEKLQFTSFLGEAGLLKNKDFKYKEELQS